MYIYIYLYIYISSLFIATFPGGYLSKTMTEPLGLPHQLGFAMAALGMTVVAAVSLALGRRGPWRYV